MASKDFLPGPDARFDLWLANFSSQLSKSGAAFGFSPDELNQMIAASNLFTESFGESRLANDAAKAATASKRDRRRSASLIVRPFARRLQAHPAMTDTIRATFGLSPRATTSGARSLEAPSETPLVALDFGTRGQITIHFGPNPNNENRNPLADGAIGAVIQSIALNPVEATANLEGLTGWEWLDNTTASPYVHVLDPGSSRLLAYRVAYLYRRGKRGPWSAAAQAAATF